MAEAMKLGFEPGPAIPPVAEDTTYVPAGAVSIGVEYRVLTDEILANLEGIEVTDDPAFRGFNDEGTSLHVVDAASGAEHLRFDVFDDDPHYHYLDGRGGNRVVIYDVDGIGPMWEWALTCLRERLPAMLRQAGATELAEQVDAAEVARAIPEIEKLARAATDQHAAALEHSV
jgi:hypothetical protein